MKKVIFGKHINEYYKKYGARLVFGLIVLATVDYMQLMIPNLYQLVINGMNEGVVTIDGVRTVFDLNVVLNQICLPLVGIIISIVVGRFTWRMAIFGAAIKVEADLRNKMFDHAKDLSREYYQVNKVGNLMSLFTNDLDTIQECFGWGILQFFDALFLGGLAVIKMFRMDFFLTLLSLIPMGLLFASSTIVGKYMMSKWEIRQEAFSKMSDFSQETFSGIAVIKAFVKEGLELMAFKKLNEENEKVNIDYARMAVLLRIIVTLLIESVICVILGYGGYLVYNGKFNAGELVEFIGYFNSTIWPIMALSDLIDMASRGQASLKRISELLDAKQDVMDRPNVRSLENVKGDVEFRDLTFRYPDGDSPVLEQISFKIKAGESVGIVGKTGSGKSTLVDLILRIYNVPDETIFIDGNDVNDVAIRDVRAGCAYVPQDNFLFSDTIENNIAFGTNQGTRQEVVEAAALADIDRNIKEFQKGYGTVLGERGVTVSGGQKQRISIARALMKDAPILILDDSVSAVDTKTEKTILGNLHATRAGKTTILIAHRISTIEKLDKIIFMDDGKIVAIGSHDELYTSCPEYQKMVELQQLEEEGGAK